MLLLGFVKHSVIYRQSRLWAILQFAIYFYVYYNFSFTLYELRFVVSVESSLFQASEGHTQKRHKMFARDNITQPQNLFLSKKGCSCSTRIIHFRATRAIHLLSWTLHDIFQLWCRINQFLEKATNYFVSVVTRRKSSS